VNRGLTVPGSKKKLSKQNTRRGDKLVGYEGHSVFFEQ